MVSHHLQFARDTLRLYSIGVVVIAACIAKCEYWGMPWLMESGNLAFMSDKLIYHLVRRADWLVATEKDSYTGTGDDLRDGFLHFSTREQVAESAARHRAGISDLLLIGVDPGALGDALKWEPSRGGQLFPHLFGDLPMNAVARIEDLPLGDKGDHVFPEDIPAYTVDE